ncbi:MAG: hypothetical protein FWD13_10445 [Treponema sp.]|nr:hypothetical protein [Treponema sp.]
MKNFSRWCQTPILRIITFILVIGFLMLACDLDGNGTGTHSLNGVWELSNGRQITISGSTAVMSSFGSSISALTQDAINKNYLTLGGQDMRNLKSTGNLTWSGQARVITGNLSSPNVATGTDWANCSITMSADGQTFQMTYTYLSNTDTETFTRSSYSLNGVWELSNGRQITISGSTAVISSFGSSISALTQDAINKNYLTLGGQDMRNLQSTGSLTWSGQARVITGNLSSPNVATGTDWANCSITMSTNGQTFQMTYTYLSNTDTETFTRKR